MNLIYLFFSYILSCACLPAPPSLHPLAFLYCGLEYLFLHASLSSSQVVLFYLNAQQSLEVLLSSSYLMTCVMKTAYMNT